MWTEAAKNNYIISLSPFVVMESAVNSCVNSALCTQQRRLWLLTCRSDVIFAVIGSCHVSGDIICTVAV